MIDVAHEIPDPVGAEHYVAGLPLFTADTATPERVGDVAMA